MVEESGTLESQLEATKNKSKEVKDARVSDKKYILSI